MRALIILFLISFELFACCKITCSPMINIHKQQSMQQIKQAYQKTNQDLDKLEKNYKAQIEQLKKVTDELNLKVELLKAEILEDKNILFLLEKFNNLKNLNIDLKAIK